MEEKQENYTAAVRKRQMLAATNVKNYEKQWKDRVNRNTNIIPL